MTEHEIAKSREYARKVAEAAPPLTPDQQLRLAVLLRPDMPVGIKPGKSDVSREQTA